MTQIERIERLAASSRIKLVATDMDGTLLNPEGEVAAETLAAMRALKKNGVKILLCSGRTQGMMAQFCAALPVLPTAVSCNGGVIYDFSQKKVVDSREIEKSTVCAVTDFAMENFFDFMAYSDKGEVFYLEGNARIPYFNARNISLALDGFDEIPLVKIDKSLECFEGKRICKMLLSTNEQNAGCDLPRFWDFVKKFPDIDAAKSAEFLLDIMARGASKGSALKFAAKILSIPLSQTFAVGDNQNDVSMLRAAGISACISNGDDSAKAAADFVTDKDCGENGWIFAVERALEETQGAS